MTTRVTTAGPVGYEAVEFLDIPPMGETVGNPPHLEARRDRERTSTPPGEATTSDGRRPRSDG